MPNKKLYPGVGAKGTIMTLFIKPKNSFQGKKDKDHRSVVVLKEHYYEGRKLFFRFTVDEDDDRTFYASSRMVRIDAEGKVEDFFDKNRRQIENAETTLKQRKESTIKWKNSKARQLLYQDIMDGNVALEEGDETKTDLSTLAKRKKNDRGILLYATTGTLLGRGGSLAREQIFSGERL